MKKTAKLLSVLLLVSLLLTALSGCHGSKGLPEFAIPAEFDTTRDYEITFWAKNDTNKTQTEIYNKAIEDFQKIYPDVFGASCYGKRVNRWNISFAFRTFKYILLQYFYEEICIRKRREAQGQVY